MNKSLFFFILMMFSINCFSGELFTEEFTGKVVELSTCYHSDGVGGYAIVKLKNNTGVVKGAYWGMGDPDSYKEGMKRAMYSTLLSAYIIGSDINIMTETRGDQKTYCGVLQSYILRGVRFVSN